MTTENTTESSVISRRTILRTTANAAWLVPAITVANAVPAMAACTPHSAAKFSVAADAAGKTSGTLVLKFTQKFTVTSIGGAGTATLVVTLTRGPSLLTLVPITADFAISSNGGWTLASTTGTPGTTGSKYFFTHAFPSGCGEAAAAQITLQYSTLAIGPKPTLAAVVTPA